MRDDLVSGSFSIQFDIDPNTMTYFAFNRGGKAGGYGEFNTIPFDPAVGGGNPARDALVGNERANTWEAGVKSTLFDQVRLNAALFWIDVYGLQQLVFTGQFASSNDRARSRGFEGSLYWQATPELSFSASGTWADARNLDDGTRLAQSPRFSGTLGADWSRAIGRDLELGLGVLANHRSSKYNQLGEALFDPAFTTVGLNARLTGGGGRWFAAIDATNIGNAFGADFGFPGPDPFVARFDTTAPLRRVNLSAGVRF